MGEPPEDCLEDEDEGKRASYLQRLAEVGHKPRRAPGNSSFPDSELLRREGCETLRCVCIKWSKVERSAELKLLRFCAFLASRACGN